MHQYVNNKIQTLEQHANNPLDEHHEQHVEAQLQEWRRRLAFTRDSLLAGLHDRCLICLSNKQRPVITTCCQNSYCGSCLDSWFKHSFACPVCKTWIHPLEDVLRLDKRPCDDWATILRAIYHGDTPTTQGGAPFSLPMVSWDKVDSLCHIVHIISSNQLKGVIQGPCLVYVAHDAGRAFIINRLRGSRPCQDSPHVHNLATLDQEQKESVLRDPCFLFFQSFTDIQGCDLSMVHSLLLVSRPPDLSFESACVSLCQRINRTVPLVLYGFYYVHEMIV
jgi:hypothetical protein